MRWGSVTAVAVVALAGCGNSAPQNALEWHGEPYRYIDRTRGVLSLAATVRNTASHDVTLDPKAMRLLDKDGQKVPAQILVGAGSRTKLVPKGLARVGATWSKGDPARLDYGDGTLQLPPG